jgi:hypothetical protein
VGAGPVALVPGDVRADPCDMGIPQVIHFPLAKSQLSEQRSGLQRQYALLLISAPMARPYPGLAAAK